MQKALLGYIVINKGHVVTFKYVDARTVISVLTQRYCAKDPGCM